MLRGYMFDGGGGAPEMQYGQVHGGADNEDEDEAGEGAGYPLATGPLG